MNGLSRICEIPNFLGFYFKEMIWANLRLAADALSPAPALCPAVVDMPLKVETDFEILLLSNLIAMTPGTLPLDVSTDRSTLFVHVLYAYDEGAALVQLQAIEAHVLKLLRSS